MLEIKKRGIRNIYLKIRQGKGEIEKGRVTVTARESKERQKKELGRVRKRFSESAKEEDSGRDR